MKCELCDQPVNLDSPDTHHQILEWVRGEKKHGGRAREYTGKVAHEDCVDKIVMGQNPEQEPLF